MIEVVGILATVIAVVGVMLNNRKSSWCFSLWMISNAITLSIHVSAGIWSLAARDLVFLILAVDGLKRWTK